MNLNVCQSVAPSMAAASKTSVGIIFNPALEASMINGKPYHTAGIKSSEEP